jgi:hypothetical protein
MASNYKVLGQINPSATTNTTLYTVPSLTSTVCSTLSICNLGISTTYRVAVRPAGEGIANKHYIAHDASIPQNDTVFLTLGITLANTDVITVYGGTANLSFSLFGTELT